MSREESSQTKPGERILGKACEISCVIGDVLAG